MRENKRRASASRRSRLRTASSAAGRRPRSVSSKASERLPRRASTPAGLRALTPTDPVSARVVKRSLVIAGHRTSISIEDAFWRRLRAIAAKRGQSLNGLAATVDATRGDANLSSAIRVFVLEAEGDARPD